MVACNQGSASKNAHPVGENENVPELSDSPEKSENQFRNRSPLNDTLDFYYFPYGELCGKCQTMGIPFRNPFALFFKGGYMLLHYTLSFKSQFIVLITTSAGVEEIQVNGSKLGGARGDAGPVIEAGFVTWSDSGVKIIYEGVDRSYDHEKLINSPYKSYHQVERKGGSVFHFIFEDYLSPQKELNFEDWKDEALVLEFTNYPYANKVFVRYKNEEVEFENQQ